MSETYILADPRTGEIRYVGFTGRTAEARLRDHMASAVPTVGLRGWLWKLKNAKRGPRRPLAITIATFNCERRTWLELRAKGARLFNEHAPPKPRVAVCSACERRADDPAVKSCTHTECGLAERRAA